MNTFHLDIVTIYGNFFSDEVESLLVHTDDGDVEILAGHADFLAAVATGRARILKDGKERFASCSGGFISVTKSGVKLVTNTFEFADEIDLNRAKAAKEKAERAIERAKNDREINLAKAKLTRAINRINIAEKK
nr:ATP synthase F1 subunit epsilon [Oscillospiraceae bacterium]